MRMMDESYDLLTGDHFHVILHPNKLNGLIFNRLDRTVTTINYDDAKELSNVKYVGRIYGIVGCFLDRHLVLIKNRTRVGCLYDPNTKTDHDVYVITQVQVIDLPNVITSQTCTSNEYRTENSVKYNATLYEDDTVCIPRDADYPSMEMQQSESFSSLPVHINTNSYMSNQSRSNHWNPFKLANSLKPIMPTQLLGSSPSNASSSRQPAYQQGTDSKQSQAQIEHMEDASKRLVEEMVKLFNNTNSFYYSPTLDLTNRFSRTNLVKKTHNEPVWQTADERFFWNKHMLKDLIELSRQEADANLFISVILKGFIEIREQRVGSLINFQIPNESSQATSMRYSDASVALGNNDKNCDTQYLSALGKNQSSTNKREPDMFRLALVSRRSVFRAGTRYRRRGCDIAGNCANFVETEQIFKVGHHFTSMVILRGSIPLFWYQTGFNYRPPPVLTKSESENHEAFKKHFADLISQYNTQHIIAVDCTEQSGREKALHDAYKNHLNKFRNLHPEVGLIEFDYHKYCRGRQCTDAQIEKHLDACGLTQQVLKDAKYYWNDGEIVLEQQGVFRVNCLDCSDRTNVVQRIIALQILDLQLARLGIIAPDVNPEDNQCKRLMHAMWSTNGNVLSTQYCGTRALFGGDRKLAGYLKDTYSSASRYYISKFRDVYRQAAIDAMLGVDSVDAKNLETGQFKDHYELPSFDPVLAGQRGGAILRDVGNRVSNRLARLKGRFNARPEAMSGEGSARFHQLRSGTASGIAETGLIETLGEMTIDWPSAEELDAHTIEPGLEVQEVRQPQDIFTQYADCDDRFQDDDEFSQLMLSIDPNELQHLREEEKRAQLSDQIVTDKPQEESSSKPEEIDLKESRGVLIRSAKDGNGPDSQKINTTST